MSMLYPELLPDGPDGIRWCTRCKASVPISEWRFEIRNEYASIVHTGQMRNCYDSILGDEGVCCYRERIPTKLEYRRG